MGGFVFVVVLACVGFVAFCAFICLEGVGGLDAILSCAILLCEGLFGVVFVGGFGCLDSDFAGVGCVGFVLCVVDCGAFDCIISLPFCCLWKFKWLW